jgi:hypothetical protein
MLKNAGTPEVTIEATCTRLDGLQGGGALGAIIIISVQSK